MDAAGRLHLLRIRLTFQDVDLKSQPTFKAVNDFIHLLALYIPVEILFYNLNCHSVQLWPHTLYGLFKNNVILNLMPGKT